MNESVPATMPRIFLLIYCCWRAHPKEKVKCCGHAENEGEGTASWKMQQLSWALKEGSMWDFPGGPVVRLLASNAGGLGLSPWSGD